MKYMPMSDDEWQSISAKYQGDDDSEYPWESYIEKVILARIAEQGLVIVPKDAEIGDAVQEAELYEPPQADAERVALIEEIEFQINPLFCAEDFEKHKLLRKIRAYLGGDAPKPAQPIIQSQQYNDEIYR